MAKKVTEIKSKKPVAAPAKAVSTPVRNTAIPKLAAKKAAPAAAVEVSFDMIAKRAFEIYASGKGGSESDNWFAAERQLRSGL